MKVITPPSIDPDRSFLPTPIEPSTEVGLVRGVDQILEACQAGEGNAETVLQRLVENQILPPGIMNLLRERIEPLLEKVQEQLRVAETVPAAKNVLILDAQQKLTVFLREQQHLLEAYQTINSLDAPDALEVTRLSFEHGFAYDGVPTDQLVEMVEWADELRETIRERIIKEVVERVKTYIETRLTTLEHTGPITIKVTKVSSPEQQAAAIQEGWAGYRGHQTRPPKPVDYQLILDFDQTPDDPMESRGTGVSKDMHAISKILQAQFPGIHVSQQDFCSTKLGVRLPW